MIYASEAGRCERNDKGIKKGKEIRKNQRKFKIREIKDQMLMMLERNV